MRALILCRSSQNVCRYYLLEPQRPLLSITKLANFRPSGRTHLHTVFPPATMKGPFLGMTGTKLPTRRSSARLSKRAKVDANGAVPAGVSPAAVAPNAPSPTVASPPKARVPSAPRAPRAQGPKKEEAEELELLPRDEITRCTTLPQPHLSFSLQEAKEHLCRMDVRFGPLFDQIELGMYKEMLDGEVKELNLFRCVLPGAMSR